MVMGTSRATRGETRNSRTPNRGTPRGQCMARRMEPAVGLCKPRVVVSATEAADRKEQKCRERNRHGGRHFRNGDDQEVVEAEVGGIRRGGGPTHARPASRQHTQIGNWISKTSNGRADC